MFYGTEIHHKYRGAALDSLGLIPDLEINFRLLEMQFSGSTPGNMSSVRKTQMTSEKELFYMIQLRK